MSMAFERIVNRRLPDGSTSKVHPFHISMKGMESIVLCRDVEDYDVLQKYFHICTWQSNVLVISNIVMSNHGHLAVLAVDYETACKAGEAIKKNYSLISSGDICRQRASWETVVLWLRYKCGSILVFCSLVSSVTGR